MKPRLKKSIEAEVGLPVNAHRFTVNIADEVASELRRVAYEQRVSESSVIEIALRQLFRRVGPDALGTFLRQHGACLRRRSP